MTIKGRKSLIKQQKEKIECLNCHIEKSEDKFYVNANPLFSVSKTVVCKDCLRDFIGDKNSGVFLDRVKLVLALLNRPFLPELLESKNGDWSEYIREVSSLRQNSELTFSHSSFGSVNIRREANDENSIYSPEELNEMRIFWGKNKNDEDIEYLQNEYDRLLNSYECDSYAMELLFQEAAQQRLTIKKLREESKPVDKELKTLQDLLGSASIKPSQETGANASEQATFGTLIKKYENEKPIPEPDPEWKDVDGIIKYVQIWFLGHLCRMLGINNEYARMYEEELAKHTVDAPIYNDDEDDNMFEDGVIK